MENGKSTICPRTILGTWDDHDYGWNDGDSRNEQKWVRCERVHRFSR